MPDHFVGGIENRLGRAIVLLQPDDAGILELLLKAQDILYGGASEFIDTLVIVANDTEVLVLLRKQAHQTVLGVVGVLVLIYQ